MVLIVDDTPDCVEPLARLLRFEGHTVRSAANGQEALDALEEYTPDLVILDLMMPVMDGAEFLERIRGDSRWRDLRVIVLTGYAEGANIGRVKQLGVEAILRKGSTDYLSLLDAVPSR